VYGENLEVAAVSKMFHMPVEIHVKLTSERGTYSVVVSHGTTDKFVSLWHEANFCDHST
jgi:hypothetical protein